MREFKTCPCCGGNTLSRVGDVKDFLVSGEVFHVDKCSACCLVFTNPSPKIENLSVYYLSDAYISHVDTHNNLFEKAYGWVRGLMLSYKIGKIRRYFGSLIDKKLLDFGCATGEFLLKANKNGFQIVGVEPNIDAADKAREKGLDVYAEPGDALGKRGPFDVVTLWHVLEHIPSPADILQKLYGLMAHKGLIVVAVPDYTSYDGRFYDMEWAAWDAPRHLFHFEEKTLIDMMAKQGFFFHKKHPLFFDAFYVSILTEKNRNSGFIGVCRAIAVGSLSVLLSVLRVKPWSSSMFLFTKG